MRSAISPRSLELELHLPGGFALHPADLLDADLCAVKPPARPQFVHDFHSPALSAAQGLVRVHEGRRVLMATLSGVLDML